MLAVVSDLHRSISTDGSNIDHYEPVIVSAHDYYPFGSLMPGRSWNLGDSISYRFGFNGKENDNEVKGEENQQDYGMRVYDPRIGKFLSVDPITAKYPELTPYQFASNRPIQGIDLDGLEVYFNNSGEFIKYGNDVSKTAPVILLSNDKEIATNLTNQQLKNRVYWFSGEGVSASPNFGQRI